MANVRHVEIKDIEQNRKHSDVTASAGLIEIDGERFIQIDTYGSAEREFPGKLSQSIRLSKSAFDQLCKLAEGLLK